MNPAVKTAAYPSLQVARIVSAPGPGAIAFQKVVQEHDRQPLDARDKLPGGVELGRGQGPEVLPSRVARLAGRHAHQSSADREVERGAPLGMKVKRPGR